MSENKTRQLIRVHEGKRNQVYRDTKGFFTIGIGHLVLQNEMATVLYPGYVATEEKILEWFEKDYKKAVAGIQRKLPNFKQHSWPVRAALIDMTFQLGEGNKKDKSGIAGFSRMLGALNGNTLTGKPNYGLAAEEALDSKWFKIDTPKRAAEIARMLRTQKFPRWLRTMKDFSPAKVCTSDYRA